MSRGVDTMLAVAQYSRDEFSWSTWGCVGFVSRVVRDVTGRDFGFDRDGDEAQAQAMIDQAGGLAAAIESVIGCPPCPLEETIDGDPVVLRLPTVGEILAVRMGGFAVYKTQTHVRQVPIWLATHGWRIEECRPR